MQHRLFAVPLVLAFTACAAHKAPTITEHPVMGLVHIVAAIPAYDPILVTRDETLGPMYALVGTVVDSDSGQPLSSSEIFIRRASDGKIVTVLTDSRGGFIVSRIPPGQYGMIVRRLGYISVTDLRSATAGIVDTLRLKMAPSRNWLQKIPGRTSAFRN